MRLFPDLSVPVEEEEWMDTRPFHSGESRRSLLFLAKMNRWFGGTATVLRPFMEWSRRWRPGAPVHILDVGTGGADIPIAVVKWARENGHSLRVTAVELMPEIAAFAKQAVRPYPEITVWEREWQDIPRELTFDYVIASLFLHHVPLPLRSDALVSLDQRARKGLVVSDLIRTHPSYWAVKAASIVWGDAVVRHDGPLSVRRAFRVNELESLAHDAGLSYVKVRTEPWCRISLAGEKA
ncbi:MAG: methyltransferase domain-containing protein [Elusimicrobia bacterium]|nr:methyltransferase domain-containing protein [Elusimicrobiota bacterium]